MFSLCLGTLSSIPTALTRWTDECKVLDAESMHDCVAGELAGQYNKEYLTVNDNDMLATVAFRKQ